MHVQSRQQQGDEIRRELSRSKTIHLLSTSRFPLLPLIVVSTQFKPLFSDILQDLPLLRQWGRIGEYDSSASTQDVIYALYVVLLRM